MCLFCKIVNKEIPAQIVFEDENYLAFKDISPQAPIHVLVIPKAHIESLDTATEAHALELGKLQLVAAKVARLEGIAESGYRLVTNCGPDGGQTVAHIHYHLLGGEGLGWPPFPKKNVKN